MAKKLHINLTDLLSFSTIVLNKGIGVTPTSAMVEGFEDDTLFNADTAPYGWVVTDATDNLAISTDHVGGGFKSLTFDKVADASVSLAGIQRTLPNPIDLSEIASLGRLVVYFFPPIGMGAAGWQNFAIRLGSSLTDNFAYLSSAASFTEGQWNKLEGALNVPSQIFGNGADFGSISWVSILTGFSLPANTFSGMIVDSLLVEPFFTT